MCVFYQKKIGGKNGLEPGSFSLIVNVHFHCFYFQNSISHSLCHFNVSVIRQKKLQIILKRPEIDSNQSGTISTTYCFWRKSSGFSRGNTQNLCVHRKKNHIQSVFILWLQFNPSNRIFLTQLWFETICWFKMTGDFFVFVIISLPISLSFFILFYFLFKLTRLIEGNKNDKRRNSIFFCISLLVYHFRLHNIFWYKLS